ncbi:hypothetical protein Egran_06789 [Elaphomyces granulatus]|uniref:Autophagy-related protein 13 n=1 Tax=Elaphomyces granulatus TaxID=519963 RepID=A0A232LMQ4_9EURO|nr:hypothetical protein Egran_06789 [Elaphomyces granulatus]
MHQLPRSPGTASPAGAVRPGSARGERFREQESGPGADGGAANIRALDMELRAESLGQAQKTVGPAKEALAKLSQIITNYHNKAALIILHSRVDLPPVYTKGSDTPRVNRWFNVELDETDVLREPMRRWKTGDPFENRPPPLIIETYLDPDELTNSQSLVFIDDVGKRWDVVEALAASGDGLPKSGSHEIILERWKVALGEPPGQPPADLGPMLPTVYKKSIVLFRSLFTYSKFLPAWKLAKRNGKMRTNPALQIKYRIRDGWVPGSNGDPDPKLDHLTIPLQGGSGRVVETYSFGTTESPAGPFSVQVTYRRSCEFRVDDSEALLSSRFMGADDDFFRPSLLPTEETSRVGAPESGSLPLGRTAVEHPDRTRAYGSLSTFHQVGPVTGASPISTLRAARALGTSPSPPPPSSSPLPPPAPTKIIIPAGRTAALVGEGHAGMARRPSGSFQPFKAPPLSASPALGDSPLGAAPRIGMVRPPTTGPSADATNRQPTLPGGPTPFPRRSTVAPPDQAIVSPNSASPKPSSISKYSSSFSHRRGRPSSGGTTRADDDNNSSGKGSATSSTAQPGSGILAEATGTSADSMQADDEKISDFLKMLDLRKDLLNPTRSAAVEAATRRTSAALTRFQRMRDSNSALSDSLSSSLLLHRSSTSSSRQLSGVPPMVHGTSLSTSSSPGRPISSPHTPHTPAIPSRLSAINIVSYNDPEEDSRRRRPRLPPAPDSPLEENASDDNTALNPTPSGAAAIDIPVSPRPFAPGYRRSNSVAQDRRTPVVDDDEIFPFGMRSISLGAEDRSHSCLGGALRPHEFENPPLTTELSRPRARPQSTHDDLAHPPPLQAASPDREFSGQRGASGPGSGGPSVISTLSSHPYPPRFPHSRGGRGSSGGPHSHPSPSSSLARGNPIPLHHPDHERDRDGIPGGKSRSSLETRRVIGQRPSSGRISAPQMTSFDEDEPLLFAMSDFGASRRSLEDGGRGSPVPESGANPGSRRGSGRRDAALAGPYSWQ